MWFTYLYQCMIYSLLFMVFPLHPLKKSSENSDTYFHENIHLLLLYQGYLYILIISVNRNRYLSNTDHCSVMYIYDVI